MAGDTLTTGDGLLKDSYAQKKAVTRQPSGFQKLAPFHKRIKGVNFSKLGNKPTASITEKSAAMTGRDDALHKV